MTCVSGLRRWKLSGERAMQAMVRLTREGRNQAPVVPPSRPAGILSTVRNIRAKRKAPRARPHQGASEGLVARLALGSPTATGGDDHRRRLRDRETEALPSRS